MYLETPYNTNTQKTVIRFPNAAIQNYTDIKPREKKGNSIHYGPFDKINQGLKENPVFRVHYESKNSIIRIKELTRDVELSHWGSVASVQDQIELHHDGAKYLHLI